MKRIVDALNVLEEAKKIESEAFEKLKQGDGGKEKAWPNYLKALNDKCMAEIALQEIRKAVLSECVSKREVRTGKKIWYDSEGNEHTIEYLVV